MMDIEIRKIIVNKLPEGCGDCPLMYYLHDTTPVCPAIPEEYWEITGNPYEMKYRRSDCKLRVENERRADNGNNSHL